MGVQKEHSHSACSFFTKKIHHLYCHRLPLAFPLSSLRLVYMIFRRSTLQIQYFLVLQGCENVTQKAGIYACFRLQIFVPDIFHYYTFYIHLQRL